MFKNNNLWHGSFQNFAGRWTTSYTLTPLKLYLNLYPYIIFTFLKNSTSIQNHKNIIYYDFAIPPESDC